MYSRAKKFLKTPSSKHQIFVKDLLYPYQSVSSKCCVQKDSQQNTDIVNRLTPLGHLGVFGFWGYLATSDAKSDVIFLLSEPDFL